MCYAFVIQPVPSSINRAQKKTDTNTHYCWIFISEKKLKTKIHTHRLLTRTILLHLCTTKQTEHFVTVSLHSNSKFHNIVIENSIQNSKKKIFFKQINTTIKTKRLAQKKCTTTNGWERTVSSARTWTWARTAKKCMWEQKEQHEGAYCVCNAQLQSENKSSKAHSHRMWL